VLEPLVHWLVLQPAHIFAVAGLHVALWVLLRTTLLRNQPGANVLWLPAALWLGYAAWEWLVLARTPEANIRVDLLVIWPVLFLTSLWAFVRAVANCWSARRRGVP
jgi:hypothetical protein